GLVRRTLRSSAIGIRDRQAYLLTWLLSQGPLLRVQPILESASLVLERIPDELPLLILLPTFVNSNRISVVMIPSSHASNEGSEDRTVNRAGRLQLRDDTESALTQPSYPVPLPHRPATDCQGIRAALCNRPLILALSTRGVLAQSRLHR